MTIRRSKASTTLATRRRSIGRGGRGGGGKERYDRPDQLLHRVFPLGRRRVSARRHERGSEGSSGAPLGRPSIRRRFEGSSKVRRGRRVPGRITRFRSRSPSALHRSGGCRRLLPRNQWKD